ncbi:MAG: diacylglycerol kinase family protein [bacterium]|nr:diacylglycerol kinase family protein [bacterium]MDA1024533.1 diacylglycerol kinase family protein [bacterium]
MNPFRLFFRSVSHALQGLLSVFRSERNFQLQIIAAIIVITLAFFFNLEHWERILVILLSGAVLVLEIVNTIFERISDALKPRLHPLVKDVKDMMAGASLLVAIMAATIGILIFYPHIFVLLTLQA